MGMHYVCTQGKKKAFKRNPRAHSSDNLVYSLYLLSQLPLPSDWLEPAHSMPAVVEGVGRYHDASLEFLCASLQFVNLI